MRRGISREQGSPASPEPSPGLVPVIRGMEHICTRLSGWESLSQVSSHWAAHHYKEGIFIRVFQTKKLEFRKLKNYAAKNWETWDWVQGFWCLESPHSIMRRTMCVSSEQAGFQVLMDGHRGGRFVPGGAQQLWESNRLKEALGLGFTLLSSIPIDSIEKGVLEF